MARLRAHSPTQKDPIKGTAPATVMSESNEYTTTARLGSKLLICNFKYDTAPQTCAREH